LRALEERRFFPVGSDRERRMNVRVLAATNRDPKQMIAKGLLREDLFYRLATVVIRIPPLRERPTDIDVLADHFCAMFRAEFRRPKAALTPAARQALRSHDWPGNVRELKNVIERAMMLADSDDIGPDVLELPVSHEALEAASRAESEPLRLDDLEKQHIIHVLESAGGSRSRAAAMLGISRSTLWEKVKRYGLGS
jgi:transcriptional regulator with PAS, ATPase and Fis domain